MYCLKCGRQYADTGTFCPYCGHKPEVAPKGEEARSNRPRRKLKASRSQTIIGSPGMFRPDLSGADEAVDDSEETTKVASRRPAITDTERSDRKPQRRLFHQRPKSAAPSRTFVRARGATHTGTDSAPQHAEPMLITATQLAPSAAPVAEAIQPPTPPALPSAPPPLPPEPPPEPKQDSFPSTDVAPPPTNFVELEDATEPGIDLGMEVDSLNPPESFVPAAAPAAAPAIEEPAALTPSLEREPEKRQPPSEEKSIEIDSESGLILPSPSELLGLDADALVDDVLEDVALDLLPDQDLRVEEEMVRTEAPPAPASPALNMTFAQGSSPESVEAADVPDEDNPDAELHARWEQNFDFDASDDELQEDLMVLGGDGGIARDNLSATRMDEPPPTDDEDFDDFVELTEDDDPEEPGSGNSTKTGEHEAAEDEDDETKESSKRLSKRNLLAAVVLVCGLAAGTYFFFFSGPGFETRTIKLASTYLPESSDVVVGMDYAKLRSSRIYGKVRTSLEDSVQTIRLFHKKAIVSAADVTHAVVGLQGEGDSVRYLVGLQGQFDASSIDAGLRDTFSWGDKARERQISGTTFHGNPYEVGLTETGDLLFMSHRGLTEKAMQIKAAGAGNFLKREKFERALRMVKTDGAVWGVLSVTPWLLRVVSPWMEVPMNMISTGDVIAFSIDTDGGIGIHLAAILNDEEQVVIIEDFVNTLEDRMSPIVSADDFDKEDKGALMEVVKSRRFKRENDSLQFSIKASDEVLDDYFEPVYQMLMGLIETYHKKTLTKGL